VFLVQAACAHGVRFEIFTVWMVDRQNCKALSVLRTVNEQKGKMLIFCIVLIFARIFMTFDRFCCIDDKKSHLTHVLRAREVQNFDFQVSQGNAAT